MGYKILDMERYPRKAHFAYFNEMAYPYMGLTVNVDIGAFLARMKGEKRPFFLSFLYAAVRAANGVPELRQRIRKGPGGDAILEYDNCRSSHTVALPDGTYAYCTLENEMPFGEFLPYAEEAQAKAAEAASVEEGEDEAEELLFISTLPWLAYAALVQPVPMPADSNPRITWGRYYEAEGKILLPVTMLCNHALVDGLHLARFYEIWSGSWGRLVGSLAWSWRPYEKAKNIQRFFGRYACGDGSVQRRRKQNRGGAEAGHPWAFRNSGGRRQNRAAGFERLTSTGHLWRAGKSFRKYHEWRFRSGKRRKCIFCDYMGDLQDKRRRKRNGKTNRG